MFRKMAWLCAALLLLCGTAQARDVQPYMMAADTVGDFQTVVAQTRARLTAAGFEIAGEYQPYPGADVIAITSAAMQQAARKSARGGYGAVMRVAVTQVGDKVQVSYTDPTYWAAAYRMQSYMPEVTQALTRALGFKQGFGTGGKQFSVDDMRHYHYTIGMEYFTDPSQLGDFASHTDAVNAVAAGLAAHKAGTAEVYKVAVGKDVKGQAMTLFGVALKGSGKDDCSADRYIMSRIDIGPRRHTAALPYEILVYGNRVEALYARFRIAISAPGLPMIASSDGATFFNIMCAPKSIETALKTVVKQ